MFRILNFDQFRSDLDYARARQPCPAAMPGSLSTFQAALPAGLARQPCRKVRKLFYGRRPACMQYCILLLGPGSLVQAFPTIKDIAILSLVYKLIRG
jgi:hypothetical protein